MACLGFWCLENEFPLVCEVEGGLQSEGAAGGYLGIILYDSAGNMLANVNAEAPWIDRFGYKLHMDEALFQELLAWLQEQQQLREGWMDDWWTRYAEQAEPGKDD